jgi:hypothetical protein
MAVQNLLCGIWPQCTHSTDHLATKPPVDNFGVLCPLRRAASSGNIIAGSFINSSVIFEGTK